MKENTDWGSKTSLEKYEYFMNGEEETDPVERLRFFLSIALSGQDWLDVEQFLDDISKEILNEFKRN